MNFFLILLAAVSAASAESYKAVVKCRQNNPDGPYAIYQLEINSVSRMTARLYPSVDIVSSWVPNYESKMIPNCAGILFGPPMEMKPSTEAIELM